MENISPWDLLVLSGHTRQGLGPGKHIFFKLIQWPKHVFWGRFLQHTLREPGTTELLEPLVTISTAVRFPSSPSLSASLNLSMALHGAKASVSFRSPSRPHLSIHILKIPNQMWAPPVSLADLDTVCAFSSQAESLIPIMMFVHYQFTFISFQKQVVCSESCLSPSPPPLTQKTHKWPGTASIYMLFCSDLHYR